jgi:hypothetical protein
MEGKIIDNELFPKVYEYSDRISVNTVVVLRKPKKQVHDLKCDMLPKTADPKSHKIVFPFLLRHLRFS